MNSESPANPTQPDDLNPPLPEAAKPTRRRHVPHLFGWLFALFAVSGLVVLMLPVYQCSYTVPAQSRALHKAKSIGLALKVFAGDHDGVYPCLGVPAEITQAPANSNEAFACLFPTYITAESIFGDKLSAYQTGTGPDNRIDKPYTGHPEETLRPGENVYAYVVGLTDDSPPSAPLVLDGTAGNAHYVSDPKKRGGVWKGAKAVIIHLDNSGALENLTGPSDARIVPDREHPGGNLLDVARYGAGVRLLDPAVAGRARP